MSTITKRYPTIWNSSSNYINDANHQLEVAIPSSLPPGLPVKTTLEFQQKDLKELGCRINAIISPNNEMSVVQNPFEYAKFTIRQANNTRLICYISLKDLEKEFCGVTLEYVRFAERHDRLVWIVAVKIVTMLFDDASPLMTEKAISFSKITGMDFKFSHKHFTLLKESYYLCSHGVFIGGTEISRGGEARVKTAIELRSNNPEVLARRIFKLDKNDRKKMQQLKNLMNYSRYSLLRNVEGLPFRNLYNVELIGVARYLSHKDEEKVVMFFPFMMDTLKNRLAMWNIGRIEPIPLETRFKWAKQLCLAYSSFYPKIFTDLKPDNIMITKEGNISLIDLGSIEEINDGGAFTKQWTPPELLKQQEVDQFYYEKIPSWALGCIFRRLFSTTGKFEPFSWQLSTNDKSFRELKDLMQEDIDNEIDSIKDLNPDCKNFIKHMLQLNVIKRKSFHNIISELTLLARKNNIDIESTVQVEELRL